MILDTTYNHFHKNHGPNKSGIIRHPDNVKFINFLIKNKKINFSFKMESQSLKTTLTLSIVIDIDSTQLIVQLGER